MSFSAPPLGEIVKKDPERCQASVPVSRWLQDAVKATPDDRLPPVGLAIKAMPDGAHVMECGNLASGRILEKWLCAEHIEFYKDTGVLEVTR